MKTSPCMEKEVSWSRTVNWVCLPLPVLPFKLKMFSEGLMDHYLDNQICIAYRNWLYYPVFNLSLSQHNPTNPSLSVDETQGSILTTLPLCPSISRRFVLTAAHGWKIRILGAQTPFPKYTLRPVQTSKGSSSEKRKVREVEARPSNVVKR